MKSLSHKSALCGSILVASLALSACAAGNIGLGISLPIGNMGSIGLGVDSNGNLGVNAGIGVGAATVSVGTTGKLPTSNQNTNSTPPVDNTSTTTPTRN